MFKKTFASAFHAKCFHAGGLRNHFRVHHLMAFGVAKAGRVIADRGADGEPDRRAQASVRSRCGELTPGDTWRSVNPSSRSTAEEAASVGYHNRVQERDLQEYNPRMPST